jgi:hypothetical protein
MLHAQLAFVFAPLVHSERTSGNGAHDAMVAGVMARDRARRPVF